MAKLKISFLDVFRWAYDSNIFETAICLVQVLNFFVFWLPSAILWRQVCIVTGREWRKGSSKCTSACHWSSSSLILPLPLSWVNLVLANTEKTTWTLINYSKWTMTVSIYSAGMLYMYAMYDVSLPLTVFAVRQSWVSIPELVSRTWWHYKISHSKNQF